MKARKIALQGLAAGALAVMTLISPAKAQNYPNRPITMIVPWAAGGGTDILVRALTPAMEQAIGQPVNVINRTGSARRLYHRHHQRRSQSARLPETVRPDSRQVHADRTAER
jgi:hypothetical protein